MGIAVYQKELDIVVKDEKNCHLNITEAIQDVIAESNFQTGLVIIHTLHTTTGLTNAKDECQREPTGFLVQEEEPLLMEDLKFALDFGAKKFLCMLPLLTKGRPRIMDILPEKIAELAMESAMSLIKPLEGFKHDNFAIRTVNMGPDERKNAEAHLKAMMLRECLLWTFANGRLNLGQWQSILFWDFDSNGRKKEN